MKTNQLPKKFNLFLEEIFGQIPEKNISSENFINFWTKKYSLNRPASQNGDIERIIMMISKKNLISRESFLNGIPKIIVYLKEELTKRKSDLSNLLSHYISMEKSLTTKITFAKTQNNFTGRFRLKIRNLTDYQLDNNKKYKFVVNGKSTEQFYKINSPILEFNNTLIYELEGINKKDFCTIELFDEKNLKLASCNIEIKQLEDQLIHKRVYALNDSRNKLFAKILVKCSYMHDQVAFYLSKMKNLNSHFENMKLQVQTEMALILKRISYLEMPTSIFNILIGLSLINQHIPIPKPMIKTHNSNKNYESLNNSIYDEPAQTSLFINKKIEEEVEFTSKNQKLLSIDFLDEFFFENEPQFNQIEDDRLEYSVISSSAKPDFSQSTIIWIDDKESADIKNKKKNLIPNSPIGKDITPLTPNKETQIIRQIKTSSPFKSQFDEKFISPRVSNTLKEMRKSQDRKINEDMLAKKVNNFSKKMTLSTPLSETASLNYEKTRKNSPIFRFSVDEFKLNTYYKKPAMMYLGLTHVLSARNLLTIKK